MSGRMNWDRVNRENRAWREVKRAPSGTWAPYDPADVEWWSTAAARQQPRTDNKTPITVPWGMGTSKAARRRRRRRKQAEIRRRMSFSLLSA